MCKGPGAGKSKYSRRTKPGPAWLEGKERPEMRLKREGGASSMEIMLLSMADVDSPPLEEFNATSP